MTVVRGVGVVVSGVAMLAMSGCASADDPGRAEYSYCGISFGYEHPTVIDVGDASPVPSALPSDSVLVLKLSDSCTHGVSDITSSGFDTVRELQNDGRVIMLSVTTRTGPASLTFITDDGSKRSLTFASSPSTPTELPSP
jgi:hypothetical protein